MPPHFAPGTITNDQGNHVFRADIMRFAAAGLERDGNRATRFVWMDIPYRQQASRLDKRTHEVSRQGSHDGAYPTGYEVREYVSVFC
jgi:hypothetical protein